MGERIGLALASKDKEGERRTATRQRTVFLGLAGSRLGRPQAQKRLMDGPRARLRWPVSTGDGDGAELRAPWP